jgi:cation diffusion facilitator CzcD-associated flavoprotein CzcO
MGREHVDVVIVGAGISGIGAGYHLGKNCPKKSYLILEGRDDIGGTWDLFRYPGIRSDSDMYTLGYSFKPWTDPKAIADGPSILTYLNETADEYGIRDRIRFNHYVKSASWSSEDATWTIGIEKGKDKAPTEITCNFLFMCSGYYNYQHGYTPEFQGTEDFGGRIVHPQFWTEDIDYKDKKVVVIGSGATAVTIVPEMAKDASHVTMLQRSPTYMAARPSEDKLANWLRSKLSPMTAYRLIRWRNILFGMYFFNAARKKPDQVKERLINMVKDELPEGYDVEKHFTPTYNPWDQRLCLVTNADLFERIKDGSASVVTDHIDHFTKGGIQLKSGEELEADLIVTATGLDLQLLSDIEITVDGEAKSAADSMAYKGMMYSDIPNLASSFGYTNASWTLKADLTCEYVCRLINHMDATNTRSCTPRIGNDHVEEVPWLDFTSGYVQRSIHKFPKQGDKKPWRLNQNYILDIMMLGHGKVDDGAMEFS